MLNVRNLGHYVIIGFIYNSDITFDFVILQNRISDITIINKTYYITRSILWGGWVLRRCRVSYRHRGVQLILAYSWARPAILVAGKDIGGMFLFLLFLHSHSCSSYFHVLLFHLLYLSSISFLPLSGRRHKMTHGDWRVVKPQHNESFDIVISQNRF